MSTHSFESTLSADLYFSERPYFSRLFYSGKHTNFYIKRARLMFSVVFVTAVTISFFSRITDRIPITWGKLTVDDYAVLGLCSIVFGLALISAGIPWT